MIYALRSGPVPDLSRVGGKARALIETALAGFNVPEGFVLAVDFFREWTDEIRSSAPWREFLLKPCLETCSALQERARRLRFTVELRGCLDQQLAQLPTSTVYAVRSSSPEEDLAQASFAGQYETFLAVPRADLEQRIADAFASMLNFRVVEYKRQNGLPLDNPRIAIIVQRQIRSEVSGIAFSANPNNNAFDEAMINASFGLGEAIVSGRVTPDSYLVDKVKKAILQKTVAHKGVGLWLRPDGGTVEVSNPNPDVQALTDAQILEVAALATACERHYGKPMDIEWAFESGTLSLLQSRPITTHNPLFPEMITPPGERKNLYVDVMVMSQGFFEPLSELGLDIWSRMLPAAKGGLLAKGMDGHFFDVGGREYLHVSNIAKGLGKKSLATFGNQDLELGRVLTAIDLEHEYLPHSSTKKMRRAVRAALPVYLAAIPRILGAILNPDQATARVEAALADAYHYYKREMPKEPTFAASVERGVARFAQLVMSVAGIFGSWFLAMRGLKKVFKGDGVEEVVGLLGAASPTNPTAQMGQRMLELASFAEIQNTTSEAEFIERLNTGGYPSAFIEAYGNYMERFGARGFKEVDVASPRTFENPGAFFRQLKAIDVRHNNDRDLQARKSAAYQRLLALAKERGKETRFTNLARRYMTQFGFREAPKYLFVVMIGQLRKRALELGQRFAAEGRLATREQVFDLTVEQLAKAENDRSLDLASLRERNLAPRRAVAHVKDWPKIVDSRGKIFRYVRPSEAGDLRGDAISPGVVRGRAKVLMSPYEKPLARGEILVTRATEPAWTPVFINAAAVVLEIGGPLQHGAIIAREYNLPCVSGIGGVTQRIKDGDLLEVDGTSGLVKLLGEERRRASGVGAESGL